MKLPYFIKYTDKVKAGDAKMCRIRINPKYRGDKGLMAHELEHVRQWYVSVAVLSAIVIGLSFISPYAWYLLAFAPSAMGLAYKFSKKVRLYCELRAFKVQLKVYDNKEVFLDWAANALANNYGLGINKQQAINYLRPSDAN